MGGEGRGEKGRGVEMLHTYVQTYRHTDPLTKWVVEELSLLKIQHPGIEGKYSIKGIARICRERGQGTFRGQSRSCIDALVLSIYCYSQVSESLRLVALS